MASKLGLAGGIPERRVRPIWDAIDSRQYKSALKHSSTLLSKYPNSPYALALKGLVLERMGKVEEALPVCLAAKERLYKDDSALMDDLTLSTLQMVFQRLDHLDLATSCYEHACGRFPTNVELMMGLFNCYVREYSFVKQQQTAIKMYKLVGEERFLLWAVCSIQLQVFCGNGDEKLSRLAEGLLKKHVSSNSLHEPEALIVYISILEQHKKYGEALQILSGDLGSLLMIDVDKLRIKGKLLARSGDYAAGAEVYQKILEQCPDDWECFLHYLGCLLEDDSCWNSETPCNLIHPPKVFGSKISQLTHDMFDARMSDALAFVQKLHADNNNDFLRCPKLAMLEIGRRKQLHGKDTHKEINESLVQYFSKFGHLASFTSDVEIFLETLTPDGKKEFLGKLRKSSDSHVGEPTKVLGRMVTYFKVHELIGQTEKHPTTELCATAVEMMELFCKNLKLSKDLDPQESMHGEELLSLVCNTLVQLYFRTRHLGYFVEAIMVLEYGLAVRRYVWQYKVLLLHLYSHMGAYSLANDRYKSLDVKNILMETVLHNILPQMLVSPLWVDSSNLLKDYLRFMDDHFRESADLTFLAYRHRNYSKVIEFVQFKERLQRSSQYSIAKIETSVLQLKQNADNIDDEEGVLESFNFGIHFVELSDQIGSKALSFNEDMTSRPWWTPTPERNYLLGPFEGVSYCPKENLKKEREENVRRDIERKSLLPRMVYLSIQSAAAAAPLKENVGVNGSVSVAKISSEMRLLLERYARMLGSSFGNATSIIMEVYGGSKSFEVFGSDMIDWINFAVFLNAWSLTSEQFPEPNGNQCSNDLWHVVDTLLGSCISEKMTTMQSLTSLSGDLATLIQLVTEPLAWHGLVIQSRVRSCQPAGKKKKKVGPVEQPPTLPSDKVRDSVLSLCSIVEQVSKWVEGLVNRPEDEHIDIILSSLRTDEGPGQVFHILRSSTTSIDDLEVGARIAQALRSWDSADVVREMVSGTSKVLSEFLHICQSKGKSFLAWKQLLSQA